MKMEQGDGAAIDGAHMHVNHAWGPPVPGHGSVDICRACGEKRTNYTERAECPGRPSVGLSETVSDYSPI